MNDEQKAIVGDEAKLKLETAEKKIAELKKAKEESDKKAKAVKKQIEELPAVDDLKLDDENKVTEAIAAYDALNDEQKSIVGDEAKSKLETAEKKIAELKKAKEEALHHARAGAHRRHPGRVRRQVDPHPVRQDLRPDPRPALPCPGDNLQVADRKSVV